MKINTIILSLTLSFVTLTSLITCSNYRLQKLKTELTHENLLSSDIHYKDIGLSFNGNSLVLYNVSHSKYSTLTARRMQLENTPSQFRLILTGVHGSLTSYFQHYAPLSVEEKIFDYNPNKDLLENPLLTLAILGYDILNVDIHISAIQKGPNQIVYDLIVQEQGHVKARFSAKLKPIPSSKTMWDNLKQQPVLIYLTYLDPKLKQRLDAYTSSKQLPFITEKNPFAFSLLQK